jgi:hypothetical protein
MTEIGGIPMAQPVRVEQAALKFVAITDSTKQGIVLVFVGVVVIVGLAAVLMHRFMLQSKSTSDESSMTRPVLALVLVGTVVMLAAASLTLEDEQTRNLLIGGVVSLSSAAVAFYFASSGATEARRDLLKATSGATVPDLIGQTFVQAQAVISLTSLALVKPDPAPDEKKTITAQDPLPGTAAPAGQRVTVTF